MMCGTEIRTEVLRGATTCSFAERRRRNAILERRSHDLRGKTLDVGVDGGWWLRPPPAGAGAIERLLGHATERLAAGRMWIESTDPATIWGQRDPRVVADEHFWFAHELR
jgi:hypothetical protein